MVNAAMLSKEKTGYAFLPGLTRCREEAGLKQVDLAAKLDIGRSTLRNWEKVRKRAPEDMQNAIAEVLGVSVEDLRAGKEKEPPVELFYEDRQKLLYRQRREDPNWKCQVCDGSVRYSKSHPFCEKHWDKRNDTMLELEPQQGRGRRPGHKLTSLRRIRKEQFSSGVYVAQRVGVNYTTYAKWEALDAGCDGPTIQKLARFFGVEPKELL